MKPLKSNISVRVLLLALASAVFATPVCTRIVFGDGGWGDRGLDQGAVRKSHDGKKSAAGAQEGRRGLAVRANDVTALPSSSKRWALVIGIDQYDDGDINPLSGAVKDSRSLRQALIKDCGFPSDNVILLTSDSRDRDLKPTRSNIIYRLSALANQVPADGLLLFAFSGHGVEVDNKAFLLPEEAKLSKDTLYLTDNAVGVDRVKEYINRTGVKQRIMLLDACRSKLSTGKGIDVAPMTKSYEKAFDFNYEIKNRSIDAFLTFYATGMGQESWEDPDTGQGYFTEAVVEGLSGGRNGETLNSHGEVTLGALTKYVRDTVAERTRRAGKVQVPHPVTDGYGDDLVIAKVEGRQPVESKVASAPNQVLTEEILAASEISYWNSIASKSNPELFKNYLDEYPNGRFAKPAATFLRDLEEPYWKSIAASADPNAFKTYCDIYSDGRFVDLAKAGIKKLEDNYWGSIKNSGDARAFKGYLSLYPDGRYASEAKLKIEQTPDKNGSPKSAQAAAASNTAAVPPPPAGNTPSENDLELDLWKKASESTKVDDVKQYLDQYPDGRFAREARVHLDSLTETAQWESISTSSDPQVFHDYIEKYPRGKFAKDARGRIEDLKEAASWQAISASSDPKTFSRYLRQHPRGDYADKAKARFDELTETAYWQSIADSSSVDQFSEYLKRYPDGRYASQAKARSDELTEVALWDSIASTRNKEAFNGYLKKYPNGRFTAQAKARLDTLVEIEYWSSIASSARPEPFAEYLRRYPNGLFARQAMARYNDLAEVAYWNSISASYDPQQLGDYLAKYPNGQFAGIAKERIARQKDNIAWTAVANSSDTQAIKGYLSQFPDGQYSTAAKDRITQLEEAADWSTIASSSDPEVFNGFLKKHPNSEFAPVAKAMYEERKETALWKSIATASDPDPLKEYLKLYPAGRFVEAAKNRLSELDASPAPAAAAARPSAESANKPAEKPASTPVASGAKPSHSSGEPEKKPAARPNGSESTPSASGSVSTNASRLASGLVLQAFEFNVLNFTEPGLKPNLVKRKAAYFAEDLGGPVLKLVQVPGGAYLMGDSDLVMERPQHQAAVSPFFMGEFEVTQAEWRVVAGLPKVSMDLNPDPSYFKGDDLPVGNVSWDEAVEFCARLSKKTGHLYRLPTEAEWEYACRAGTTTPFSFGDNITVDYVNFDGEHPYKNGPQGERRLKPVPVGSLGAANAFGLFDMHGNALEWCSDVWHDTYSQAPADGSSWNTGGDPSKRVLRGGDWTQPASRARSSARTAGEEKARSFNWGFRVVMEPR